MSNANIWCAIPVHNNAATLRNVVERTLAQCPRVMVVDDGSTDADIPALLNGLDCVLLHHAVNQGKGAAILTAATEAERRGARWIVTLDADGQHDPADLPKFFRALEDAGDNDALVFIGSRDMSAPHIPKGSRFGRAFSDAWVRLETGLRARDTQSGFRAWPVRHLCRLRVRARRYDFEIEALVRLLWGGLDVTTVPIAVWYPQPNERRISHFRPFLDNARLSWLHTRLMTRRLLPWPHRKLVPRNSGGRRTATPPQLNPLTFFRELATSRASPFELAASAWVGIFFGTLPLVASHSVAIAYVTARLRLNMLVSLSIQSLCMPPVVPVACVLLGFRLRTGDWMRDLAWAKIPSEYLARVGDWLIGSLVLAPVLATLAAFLVYVVARLRARHKREHRGNAFGLAWFRMLVRIGGLRVAYAMLYPVCLHYVLFDRRAVRAILPYVRHRFRMEGERPREPQQTHRAAHGDARPPFCDWLAAYKIFLEQGRMLVDRHAAIARPSLVDFKHDPNAEAEFKRLATDGGILLMSHAGNWQAAIPTLALLGKPVHLVMAVETNTAVAKTLRVGEGFRVIDARQFIEAAPQIVSALNAGEIVSFMGDRAYGAASAPVEFLGETAYFPVAAFRIAAATGKPVYFLFVPRVGRGRYIVNIPATAAPTGREGVREGLMRYTVALENFSNAYPYQCFPFADLWQG